MLAGVVQNVSHQRETAKVRAGRQSPAGLTLAIVAKSPEPGRVKTRLVGSNENSKIVWSEQNAAQFAYAALQDTFVLAQNSFPPSRLVLALDGSPEFLPLELQKAERLTQTGNDLGERMANLTRHLFEVGATAVCLIGSDTPHLPPAFITEAWGRLAHGTDVVFGPAEDGGYYLVALRAFVPALFSGIAWSTPNVLAQSLHAAKQANLRAEQTSVWYDIDTSADVVRLRTDLRRGVVCAPATHAVLSAPGFAGD